MIFEDKIEVKNLDVNTSFFDLGANSLTTTKAYREIVKKINRDFPLIKMFEYPTIKQLANFLSEIENKENKPFDLNEIINKKKNTMLQRKKARKRLLTTVN